MKFNLYEIKTQHTTINENRFIKVYAQTDYDAVSYVQKKLANDVNFQDHIIISTCMIDTSVSNDKMKTNIPVIYPTKYDILNSIFKNTERAEHMAYFNVNWNEYTETIAKLAQKESWPNETYPDNKILTNYMVHTYKKLTSEKNVITNRDYGIFNTGLFTEFYQPIYAYHDKDGLQFLTAYDLGNMNISERPPKANYFEDPSLLLFDWHYEININYKHILKDLDNIERLPDKLKDTKNILNNLNGSIETMKKRISANYKLAIPQYYENKIQLLLPLCLEDDETPSLALAVTKVGNFYQGHTCLTLDMAYNNARLIAKPESNWLSQ